jgi:two-component system NtrC family response regulator
MGILIVEDEETQRDLLEGLLNKEGYAATGAGNGERALQLVKDHTFEIVLLDYKLPDTDGLTVLKKLKEMNPEIQVIMITAFGSIENAVTALKAGAFEYLTKPIDLDDLFFKIKKVEERLHLIHENLVLKEGQDEVGKHRLRQRKDARDREPHREGGKDGFHVHGAGRKRGR